VIKLNARSQYLAFLIISNFVRARYETLNHQLQPFVLATLLDAC